MFRGTALAHRVSLTGFTWAEHQPSCQCNALSSTESRQSSSVHWEALSSAEQCADRPVTALPQSLPQNIPQACQRYYLWNVSIHFHSCNLNTTLLNKSAQYSDVATSLRGSRSYCVSSRPESSIAITIVGRTLSDFLFHGNWLVRSLQVNWVINDLTRGSLNHPTISC